MPKNAEPPPARRPEDLAAIPEFHRAMKQIVKAPKPPSPFGAKKKDPKKPNR